MRLITYFFFLITNQVNKPTFGLIKKFKAELQHKHAPLPDHMTKSNATKLQNTLKQKLLMGIEPMTSSLPMKCSTAELQQQVQIPGICYKSG